VRFARLLKASADRTSEIVSLSKDYHRILAQQGSSASTIHLIRNHAHLLAFYLDSTDAAVELLELAIKIPQVQPSVTAQCKTDLADIYLMSGEVWEATLLYSQVEKAFKYDQVGFEAKLKNARLSFYIGEFEWAKTQLDVLRAATSKLIANDAMELSLLISDNLAEDSNMVPLSMYARADLLLFRKRPDQALTVLDSLAQLFPAHNIQDEMLLKRAEIMISRQRYEVADSLLSTLIADYGHDILVDNALILQARLHDYHLNDTARAMELYEQLVIQHPGSVFVTEARNRFKELRSNQEIN
jgi:tetratricopeptide (TPR) repeat protein